MSVFKRLGDCWGEFRGEQIGIQTKNDRLKGSNLRIYKKCATSSSFFPHSQTIFVNLFLASSSMNFSPFVAIPLSEECLGEMKVVFAYAMRSYLELFSCDKTRSVIQSMYMSLLICVTSFFRFTARLTGL
jgi:hypothetical protein